MDLRIGFIGAGRLGKALAWSFTAAGLRVTAAASGGATSARELADAIPGCEAMAAQAVVDCCDLIFLATPDSTISAACAALRWRPGVSVVHCRGATEAEALQAMLPMARGTLA